MADCMADSVNRAAEPGPSVVSTEVCVTVNLTSLVSGILSFRLDASINTDYRDFRAHLCRCWM
jgi:hypothetical protein